MSQPRALLLGSGLVSKPLIRYLLINEIKLTVVTPMLDKAVSLINGHPLGTARYWTSDDRSELDRLISTHDLAISLLPAPMHPMVARRCLGVAPAYARAPARHQGPACRTSAAPPGPLACHGPCAGSQAVARMRVRPA